MEQLFKNEYLIIMLYSEKAALEIIWLSDNQSMSSNEYIEQWKLISKYVHVLKIKYLLIDAYDFDYRIVPEIYSIFSEMFAGLKIEDTALIIGKNILGIITLTDLLKHGNYNEVNIFHSKNEGFDWLELHNKCY